MVKVTRQRLWQIEHRKKGLCASCSEPAETATHCHRHAEMNRKYQREYQREYKRELRAKEKVA